MRRVLDTIKSLEEGGQKADAWLMSMGVATAVAGLLLAVVALTQSTWGRFFLVSVPCFVAGIKILANKRGRAVQHAQARAQKSRQVLAERRREARRADARHLVPDVGGQDL